VTADEQPDMAALAAAGVPMDEAIAACEAWKASHPHPEPMREREPEPFLNLAMYKEPLQPGPIISAHVVDDTDRLLSLSVLHTVTEMIGGIAKVDPTRLVWEGLSPACATEICDFIRRGNQQ
jgi:hypothetical protein